MALCLVPDNCILLQAFPGDTRVTAKFNNSSSAKKHAWPLGGRCHQITRLSCSNLSFTHPRSEFLRIADRDRHGKQDGSRLVIFALGGEGNDEGKGEEEVTRDRVEGEEKVSVESELGRGGEGNSEKMLEVLFNFSMPQLIDFFSKMAEDEQRVSFAVSELAANLVQALPLYDMNGDPVEVVDREMVHSYLKGSGWAYGAEMAGISLDTSSAKYIDWILERELRSEVFERSNFSVAYAEAGMGGERVFLGEFTGDSAQSVALLEQRLSENYPDLVLTVTEEVIGNSVSDDTTTSPACRIHHKWTLLSPPRLGLPVDLLCLIIGLLYVEAIPVTDSSVISATAQLWNSLLLSLGVLSTFLASSLAQSAVLLSYKCRPPFFFCPLPAPGIGFAGSVWDARAFLPNRASSVDLALASTCATLLSSVALLCAPPIPVPPHVAVLASSFGGVDHETALSGLLLVPSSTFDHSTVLVDIATRLSVASLPGPGGEYLWALNPFMLAGLLGLNMSILSLLPFGCSNGGLILSAIFGSNGVLLSAILTGGLVTAFFVGNTHSFWLFFGLGLTVVAGSNPEARLRDTYTFPGAVRSVLGLAAVGVAICTLLPASVLSGFFPGGVASMFEMIEAF